MSARDRLKQLINNGGRIETDVTNAARERHQLALQEQEARRAEEERRYTDPLTELARETAARDLAEYEKRQTAKRYTDPLTEMAKETAARDLASSEARRSMDNHDRYHLRQAARQAAIDDLTGVHTAQPGTGGGRGYTPTLWDRVKNVFTGATKQYAGTLADAPSAFVDARGGTVANELYEDQAADVRKRRDALIKAMDSDPEYANDPEAIWQLNQYNEQLGILDQSIRANEMTGTAARDTAQQLTQSGAEDIQRASEGLGIVGKTLVNVGTAGLQMAADVGLGAVTGGGSMLPMMIRSFGGGTQEARGKGYDTNQQLAFGLTSAATEYFSEKLFGGNPLYDSGDVGLVNKAIGSVLNKISPDVAGRVMSVLSAPAVEMLNEGWEEVVSDLLNPLMERVITGNSDEIELEQLVEDWVVGVALGGIGTAANAGADFVANRTNNAETNAAIRTILNGGYDNGANSNQQAAPSVQQPAAPQPVQAAPEITLGGADVNDVNRDIVRQIASDPEQIKGLGIDTRGKDPAQVRAEIRVALETQNDQQKAANAGIIRKYTDSQTATGSISETGANIFNSYYTGTQNPTSYIRGMTAAYNAGLNGRSIGSVDTSTLTNTQRDAAYLAGQAARTQAQKAAPNIETVQKYVDGEVEAGRMSEDGARMILDYYEGDQNPSAYISAVAKAYNAGMAGESVQSVTSPVLTRSQRDAAYMAGQTAARQGMTEPLQATVPETQPTQQAAAQAPVQKAQPTVNTTQQQKPAEAQKTPAKRAENPGLVQDENAKKAKLSYTQKRALDTIGKVLGVNVRFVDSISTTGKDGTVRKSGAQGYYDNGEIVLALDGDDPFLTTAVHESVHRIRELSESDYAYLESFVKRNMSEDKYGLAEKIKQIDEYSAEEIPEEIVADGFGRILGNEAAMRQFVAENSTAAQHIMDVVADILDRIRQALTGKDSRSLTDNQRKVYSDLAGKLDTMMKYYQDAVTNASESEGAANGIAKYANKHGKSILDLDIAWDEDNFSSIKDQMIAHQDEINSISPPVATVNYDKSAGKSYHVQLDEVLKNRFGYKIERPDGVSFLFDDNAIASLRSYVGTDEEAAAAIATPYVLKRGEIISGHKNHKMNGHPSITIAAPATLNGKTGNVGVAVLFADKDRVHSMRVLSPDGTEFVFGKTETGSETGERAANGSTSHPYEPASKGSIGDTAEKSNPHNAENVKKSVSSRGSTDAVMAQRDADYAATVERGDMETAQKMVDEAAKAAGYTVKAWHQTARDFTVFNTNNPGAALNDSETPNGIFFKTNDHDIGLEGKKQMPMFLNLGRTLNFKNREEANAWYRKNIDGYDALAKKMESVIKPIDDQMQEIENQMFAAETTDEEYERLDKEWNSLLDKMHVEEDKYRGQLRALLDGYFLGKNKPYDSIHLGYDGHRYVDGKRENVETYIVFSNTQAKSAEPVTYDDDGNVIPLSERFNPEKEDIRFSKSDRELLDAYIEQHGAIKTGEKPAREIQMPKRTTDKTKVSMTVRTVAEAGATPESFVPTIENLVANHEFDYTPYSDEAAIDKANGIAESKGWTAALTDWTKDISKGVVNKTNTALGWALYNNAVNAGDTETALTILRNIVAHQRNAAQAVQATRILKQLNPETQLYNAEKTVASLQEELKQKYGDKAPKLEIDEDLAELFLHAKDQETRDKAMSYIYKDIGRQMPTTFMDRWNAWRYLAMLGNPRTHVRNVVGNAGFMPVVAAKDLTATAIEGIVNVVSGGKLERTKGNVIGRGDLLKAAWDDYANIKDEALGESKYSERQMINKEIQEGRRIFGNTKSKAWNKTGGKALEGVRKFNGTALDKEDVLFSKPHYALALAQYCAANKISAEQIAKGEGLAKAREYAIKEAQKATYRDTNDFSQAISQLGRGAQWNQNKFTRGVSTVMEGVLPFRKTPANILARGVEYSPLGLMKSLTYDAVQVSKGNMSAAEMIDNVSAGLTGTGLLALGVYLAAEGILGMKLRGRGGSDDKKKKFADLTGHQDYALELPNGKSITLDWLAPEALPVFIGANLAEIAQEKNGNMKLADILTAVGNVTEPMLEMSCLQSLNNVFEAVGYAKEGDMNALTSALASAATSYLTQALPTLLGQAERTGEGKRMTTYTDKNSFLTGDMQYTLGKASARIPGLEYNQIPYIDAWGREELTGKFLERAANNFFNPAYLSRVVESDMEDELERVYEATGENVFPQRAAKYFNVDGERKDLTGDEYVKYATAKGQTSYVLASRMTENGLYKDLSDTDKAACIKDVYTYADQTAKTEVGGKITESWVEKAKKGVAIGISPETYILAKEAVKDVEGIKDANGKTISNSAGLQKMEIIYSMPGLNDEQRQYLFDCFGVGQTVIGYNKALVNEKLSDMRSGKTTTKSESKTTTKAKTETKTETKQKTDTADVSGSTAISAASYDPDKQVATVKWASSGKTYNYDGVTQKSWDDFKASTSKGSYVNKNWK